MVGLTRWLAGWLAGTYLDFPWALAGNRSRTRRRSPSALAPCHSCPHWRWSIEVDLWSRWASSRHLSRVSLRTKKKNKTRINHSACLANSHVKMAGRAECNRCQLYRWHTDRVDTRRLAFITTTLKLRTLSPRMIDYLFFLCIFIKANLYCLLPVLHSPRPAQHSFHPAGYFISSCWLKWFKHVKNQRFYALIW